MIVGSAYTLVSCHFFHIFSPYNDVLYYLGIYASHKCKACTKFKKEIFKVVIVILFALHRSILSNALV